jgi:hypothetical protein
MKQKYSQMSRAQLEAEIAEMRVLAQKAEAKGMINEYAVHERKILMAEAYLLDPADFKPKEIYIVKDSGDTFEISYINGVFAWGYRNKGAKLEAVPISILAQKN